MTEKEDFVRREIVAILPRLRRFARGLTGDVDLADDIVQAACVKALDNLGQWREATRVDSWMYRIVQNTFRDRLRADKVRSAHAAPGSSDEMGIVASFDGQRSSDMRMALADVQRALAQLPEEQRSIVLLVCVEGRSYAETAEIVGVPPGTVMSRLARARFSLADAVGGRFT